MISREFIYEFLNFDDIYSRENDKKMRAHDICRREMGVSCQKVGCAEPLVDINQPLRLRSCKKQPSGLR